MEIKDSNMVTRVYDKKDNFNFETIKILHFNSNIQIFRNIFLNGIKRIHRLS